MKKLIEKLKNTSIFEINFINISTMMSTFNFEILSSQTNNSFIFWFKSSISKYVGFATVIDS